VVEAVGPGVQRVKPGQHVVLAFDAPCGLCSYCAAGRSNLCALAVSASPPREHFTIGGTQAFALGGLGSFSSHTVVKEGAVIPIDDDISLEAASLLGCAVTTGWGAAVYLARVRPGDNVVVVGAGGVGVNSLQGAHNAGADVIVAVDPVQYKREQALTFGATHLAADLDEAKELLADLTNARMADVAILSVGVGRGEIIRPLLATLGLDGRCVITSVPSSSDQVDMSLFDFTMAQMSMRGNVYGGVNVHRDIPLLLGLYRRGKLKLDELVSRTYTLDEINEGYADMHAGKNLRGVVVH
jgi:Zn-dependent alcohol dehydrogenase